MRAALGLALILGGSVLFLTALQGHVPLTGATSAPVSGGVANAASPATGQLGHVLHSVGGGMP